MPLRGGFGFFKVAELSRLYLRACVVTERQKVFGELQMQRCVVGLVVLRFKRSGLRQAHILHGSGGVDAVVTGQAFAKGFQQGSGGGVVLLRQGHGDVRPQRPVGTQALAACVLLPQQAALCGILARVLQPANGSFCRSVGQVASCVSVQAHEFTQRLERRVAGLVCQQQACAGQAAGGVQPLFGEPVRARLCAGHGAALLCLSPFRGQQMPAQAP